MIVVPSGFDANCFDPLGRMSVTVVGYRTMPEHAIHADQRAVIDEVRAAHSL